MASRTENDRTDQGVTDLNDRLYELEVKEGVRTDENISVVCYFWNETGFSEPRGFLPEQVNALAENIRANLRIPHRFICITDESEGFSDDVELMPLPEEAREIAQVPTAQGHTRFPSCYRRLWTFSEGAIALGDIVLMLDIDCFITGALEPLFEFQPSADFVGWNPVQAWGKTKIGGGTWRLRTGTRTGIWTGFSRNEIQKIRNMGFNGSDQAYLSYHLGSEPVFPERWILNRQDMRRLGGKVPAEAKIVHTNGPNYMKQFDDINKVPWVGRR